MSKAFDESRMCGAATDCSRRRPSASVPNGCRHDDGVHRCRAAKGTGTNHLGSGSCAKHLGTTASGEKHGQREAAAKTLAALAMPVEGDPLEVLQAAVESAYGVMLAARALLADSSGEAYVDLYLAAIDRAGRVAKGAAEAVNEERLTKLKERETAIYEGALMRAADRFGIKPARREVFMTMVREELVAGLQEYTH